jgi:hypothetical protein
MDFGPEIAERFNTVARVQDNRQTGDPPDILA